MVIDNSLKNPGLKDTVLTIGTFDGVHLGHQMLFEILVERAKATNRESVVITFNPHPQHIIGKGINPKKILTHIDEKVSLISQLGIDHVYVIPFNIGFSKMTAKDFFNNVILNYFNPSAIIVGHDHHFGFKKQGDLNFLNLKKKIHKFKVIEVNPNYYENKIISSSWIRALIESHDINKVNYLLGRNFSIIGIVAEGDGRGRLLGFPTANIEIQYPLIQIPQVGVYLVKVFLLNSIYFGVCNVGYRPTFDSRKKKAIEVHLFLSKTMNLYGKELKVEFIQFIREEEKFASKEILIDQIKKDKAICQKILEDQDMKKGDSFLYVNHK
jgi:riboflavin kinase / FMN adenylyltransferase